MASAEEEQAAGKAALEAIESHLYDSPNADDRPAKIFDEPDARELGAALLRELDYLGYRIVKREPT